MQHQQYMRQQQMYGLGPAGQYQGLQMQQMSHQMGGHQNAMMQ
jgi:hypothetical protein